MSTISRHSVQSNLNKQTQQRKALKGTVHDLHSQILFEISMMDWGQVMHYRWHIWHTLLPQGHFSHKWRWSPLFHLPGFQAVHDAIASLRNIGDTKAKLDKGELQRNIKQIQRNMVELKELWLACCFFVFFTYMLDYIIWDHKVWFSRMWADGQYNQISCTFVS